MEKLTYEQVESKFDKIRSVNLPVNGDFEHIFNAHTKAIVDSINECISDWENETVIKRNEETYFDLMKPDGVK